MLSFVRSLLGASPSHPLKPGSRTSELYVVIATLALIATDVIPKGDHKYAALSAALYTVSRTLVKASAAFGTTPEALTTNVQNFENAVHFGSTGAERELPGGITEEQRTVEQRIGPPATGRPVSDQPQA